MNLLTEIRLTRSMLRKSVSEFVFNNPLTGEVHMEKGPWIRDMYESRIELETYGHKESELSTTPWRLLGSEENTNSN